MTAKDCLYNIPDETRFVNIFFRANGIKWREIFGRQRYSENVRQVTAPAVELQRPTRPLIRLLNRNKPFPTELLIGSRQCKQSVGRDALIPPWRNLYRLWQALQMICRIRCSHRAVAAHQTIPANFARLLRANGKHLPLQTKSRAIPHNSKCRYGERGAADAKPKAQIILDAAKVSAASGGNSEPKQGQRSQSARGFCPRSTMRVPQPDIIEHFGNADAVPQLPERCLSRKAGIVRCCPRYCPTIIYSYIHPVLLRTNLPGVYLKNRNYRLFLQTQPDFALKSLGIHKGFQGSLPYILLVFAKYPSFSLFSDTL